MRGFCSVREDDRRVTSSAGRRRLAAAGWALALLVPLSACGASSESAAPAPQPSTAASANPSPAPSPSVSPSRTRPTARPTDRPIIGATPPTWLGKRVLPRQADGFGEIRPTPRELVVRRFTLPDTVPMLPGSGFAARVTSPAPAEVIARSTWKQGCPVAATDLSWVRLTFKGFDEQRHTGELLVNKAAAQDLVSVFRQLYAAKYPIEEMRITRADELDAPPTGDGNDTGAFNCRPTVGATSYSQHAYGLAIDVNPFQNPYTKGDLVLPELASSYLRRGWVRPGMIEPGGAVVRAFDSIGWTWGGTWHSLKDLQHFSQNGT
jgi:hypothetical protein